MPCPLVPKKYKYSSLASPEQLVRNKDKNALPSRVVLCFSKSAAYALRKTQYFEKTISLYQTGLHLDLYKKKQDQKEIRVGVINDFGIGASASVLCLEMLRVRGAKEFISLGIVGSLNPNLKIGEKVFIVKAFRDEGCSYHYKASSPYIKLPHNRLKFFEKIKLKPVTSWTTDAPCRETKEEVLYFQSQGVNCVEMESSALMAVGEHYGLSAFCLGVVSDHLTPKGWMPQLSHPAIKKNLYELLNQILFL